MKQQYLEDQNKKLQDIIRNLIHQFYELVPEEQLDKLTEEKDDLSKLDGE